MVEWMDNVEMAISKVCASKVYTSAEFKREKDNFQSLCKNLERAETKKWLTESLETLMKERSADESKAESTKLKSLMERHKTLIPKIQETLVKTECYWKCYSYGDDLIPIYEFTDDLRNKSIREIFSANSEQTEEHIEKQDKVLNQLENKKKMVLDFISKGKKLMEDPNCPKFLEGHVIKLKEAWDDTNEKAQARKKALVDNMSSWEIFEEQKVECHKHLDAADQEFEQIKKIFNLTEGPADYAARVKTAAGFRKNVEEVFGTTSGANDCLQRMLPEDQKPIMTDQINELETRIEILNKTDERLAFIDSFNKRLCQFDKDTKEMEEWLDEGRKRLDFIKIPPAEMGPEDRVTKSMEFQEDLDKKSEFTRKIEQEKDDIFPKAGEKVSSDAKKFIERLKTVRSTLDGLIKEASDECGKFSEDVKYWAEFQTGVKIFDPWMKKSEERRVEGLAKPCSLVSACEILGDCKNLQDDAEAKLRVLDEAAASSQKMTSHKEADEKVHGFRERWSVVHECFTEWVARMTTLVECWNKLDGNVGELSSWVTARDSAAPSGGSELSIEKLECQLNILKEMFAEKQQLVADLDAYGPAGAKCPEISVDLAPEPAPAATE